MSTTQSQRVALVTGANKGIGLETARQLAQQGITVLLGARDEKRGQDAAERLRAEGLDVEFVHLDVGNPKSQANVAKLIEDRYGKLDILVNNAGISLEGRGGQEVLPASRVSREALRGTFETNFFNVIELTQTLLPLVRKSRAGRIVNLSSILGSLALHSDPRSPIYDAKFPAYDLSKTALNAYTVHLAHELKETPIKVNSAHPGWVKTDMGGELAPMELEDGAKTSVSLATLPPDGPTGGFFHLGQTLPW